MFLKDSAEKTDVWLEGAIREGDQLLDYRFVKRSPSRSPIAVMRRHIEK